MIKSGKHDADTAHERGHDRTSVSRLGSRRVRRDHYNVADVPQRTSTSTQTRSTTTSSGSEIDCENDSNDVTSSNAPSRHHSSLKYLDDLASSNSLQSKDEDEFSVQSHLSPKSRNFIEGVIRGHGHRFRSRSPNKRLAHDSDMGKSLSILDTVKPNWFEVSDDKPSISYPVSAQFVVSCPNYEACQPRGEVQLDKETGPRACTQSTSDHSMTSSPTSVLDFAVDPNETKVEQSVLQSWIDQTSIQLPVQSVTQSISTGEKTQKVSNGSSPPEPPSLELLSSSQHTAGTMATEMTDAAVYTSRVHFSTSSRMRLNNRPPIERWSSGQCPSGGHQAPCIPIRRVKDKALSKPVRSESIEHPRHNSPENEHSQRSRSSMASESSTSHHSRPVDQPSGEKSRSERHEKQYASSSEMRKTKNRERKRRPSSKHASFIKENSDGTSKDALTKLPRPLPPRSPRMRRKEPRRHTSLETSLTNTQGISKSSPRLKKLLPINMAGSGEDIPYSHPPMRQESIHSSPTERRWHRKQSSSSSKTKTKASEIRELRRIQSTPIPGTIAESRRRPPSLERNVPVFDPSFFISTTSHHRRTMTSRSLTWTREKEENFSDWVILVVSGWSDSDTAETYHVHRSIVGLGPRASQKLAEDFEDYALHASSSRNVSILELESSAANVFGLLLDYLYGKPLAISTTTATALRFLADIMGVERMFCEVNEFIKRDLDGSVSALIYQQDATTFKDDHLLDAAQKIILS